MNLRSDFRLPFAALSLALALSGAAVAQSRSADQLRATGQVGEQADGFLACVSSCDAAVQDDIRAINARRAERYREVAQRTGVSEAAAAQAAGQRLIAALPSGQQYRPAGGGWTRK